MWPSSFQEYNIEKRSTHHIKHLPNDWHTQTHTTLGPGIREKFEKKIEIPNGKA